MFFNGNFGTFHPILAACFTANFKIISADFWGLFRQGFEGNFDVLRKCPLVRPIGCPLFTVHYTNNQGICLYMLF